jgi:methylmalonyl-CoA/ethylmalonyl-CoA epimerase
VRDLDVAVKRYSEVLGVPPSLLPPERYAYSGLRGVRFRLGKVAISLVASEEADSPIARFLAARGEGANHISLEVTDIEQDMKDWAAKGVRFVTDAPLNFSGGKVIFAHPRSLHGVQIALVEAKPDTDVLASG